MGPEAELVRAEENFKLSADSRRIEKILMHDALSQESFHAWSDLRVPYRSIPQSLHSCNWWCTCNRVSIAT